MNKKSFGAMLLLVVICLFTGHFILALEIMLFEALSQKFMYPAVIELKNAGWSKEAFQSLLRKSDETLFGTIISVIVYIMAISEIIKWLTLTGSIWAVIMTIVYLILPILGIFKR